MDRILKPMMTKHIKVDQKVIIFVMKIEVP